jgi:hypothetical protein
MQIDHYLEAAQQRLKDKLAQIGPASLSKET